MTIELTRSLKAPPGLFVPEIENNLTRRDFLIGAGLVALVPGCGGSGESGASGETRTVRHGLGETEVPVSPGRVVALTDRAELDAMLVLGVKPVAVGLRGEDFLTWAKEAGVEGIETYRIVTEINLETVATYEPDLIIGQAGFVRDIQNELSQIAPTVATSGDIWRRNIRQTADALGMSEDGTRLLEGIGGRIAETRETLAPYAGFEVSAFNPQPDGFYVFTTNGYFTVLLEELVLSRTQAQTELTPTEGRADTPVSAERPDLLDGDIMFAFDYGEEINSEAIDEFEQSPFFERLEGVQAGRYIRLDPNESQTLYIGTALTVPVALQTLEEKIKEVAS